MILKALFLTSGNERVFVAVMRVVELLLNCSADHLHY